MTNLFFNTKIISHNSSSIEQFADHCFSPLRYFFQGRTIEIYDRQIKEKASFTDHNWKKTAWAIVCVIPGILIGIPVKLLAYCYTSARDHYRAVRHYDQQSHSASSQIDLFDLNLIYNPESGFSYSLPRSILESFLSGKAFDYKELYSSEELQNLKADIRDLYDSIMKEKPKKELLAVITAGAPGAGKTILLKQDLQAQAKRGKTFAYVCPDDVCLKGQVRTYQKDLEEKEAKMPLDDVERKKRRQDAYNKWRPGSNAAAHLILAHLIRQQYAFYFGSTSSGPATAKSFEFLKEKGYKIKLLHLTAPDDVRWKSIQQRDQIFVQTTEEDIREKGKLVPQRIQDTYLKLADEIEFFYHDAVNQDAVLAAKWIRHSDPTQGLGTLTIIDQAHYDQIKKIHNTTCETLKRPDLLWEISVESTSQIKR